MESDDQYLKASRYDLKAQSHNRRVFHRVLVAHPWRAVACAIGMGVLAAIPALNLLDAPRWDRHPWMGWFLGGFALLFVCYFLYCALLGRRTAPSNSQSTQSPQH